MIWVSNDTTIDQQTLYKNATYSLNEIVKRIKVRYINADENGTTAVDIELDGKSASIREQRHRPFGRCYTFHPKKEIRDLEIYYLKAYL